jgi:hypothetical protein
MAKTKVLNTFTAGVEKFLEQNAGVSNVIISNITTGSVTASVRIGLPEGSAYLVKDAVIPVGTSLLALDNQLIQAGTSKISVETDTTSGVEVVYTAL